MRCAAAGGGAVNSCAAAVAGCDDGASGAAADDGAGAVAGGADVAAAAVTGATDADDCCQCADAAATTWTATQTMADDSDGSRAEIADRRGGTIAERGAVLRILVIGGGGGSSSTAVCGNKFGCDGRCDGRDVECGIRRVRVERDIRIRCWRDRDCVWV